MSQASFIATANAYAFKVFTGDYRSSELNKIRRNTKMLNETVALSVCPAAWQFRNKHVSQMRYSFEYALRYGMYNDR